MPPQAGGYLLDTNILVALARGNDLGRYLNGTYFYCRGSRELPVGNALRRFYRFA
jgi:hypothetical protein